MNNYSRQREIILEVIQDNPIHPTIEQIYQLVIKKDPRISKSTVYRNMAILEKQGSIRKITIATGPDRFEYVKREHQHSICEICGKVMDFCYNFEMSQIESELKKERRTGFKVNHIILYGICENCQSKIEKNKEEGKNGTKRK